MFATEKTVKSEERSRSGRARKFVSNPVSRLMLLVGMEDREFADLVGTKPRVVQSWRLGEKSPTLDTFARAVLKATERLGRPIISDELFRVTKQMEER